MNILFVYSTEQAAFPNGLLAFQERMQFGISYISSVLKKHGHRADLVVLRKLFGHRNFIILKKYIHDLKPRLICFTAVATQYDFIRDIAIYVKRAYPDIYLLIGGPHITLNPQEAVSADFDAVCIGEGEYPVLELAAQLERGLAPSQIPNLWIKHGSDIEKNSPREFLQDLDSLPFPDRGMWQKWMDRKAAKRCAVLLSRGCPFTCPHCCNHALGKVASGGYVRYRSPGNIREEIQEILRAFPRMEEIYLETETITANQSWCLDLCSELQELNAGLRRPLSFGANIRLAPQIDLDRIFSAMHKSNFRFVNMGIESGSENVRREVLGRDYSNNDIINNVRSARRHGLQICFFNLIGIPGETRDDFKETIRINRLCRPDWHYTSIFFPYPGSDLYSLCREQGLLKGSLALEDERWKAPLDLPGFSRRQIQESFRYFDYYVYYGCDPQDKILIQVLRLKVALKKFFRALFRCLTGIPFFDIILRPLEKKISGSHLWQLP